MTALVFGTPTSDEESPIFWLERCIDAALAYQMTIKGPDKWWKPAASIALMERAEKTWIYFVEHDGAGLPALMAMYEASLKRAGANACTDIDRLKKASEVAPAVMNREFRLGRAWPNAPTLPHEVKESK